MFSISACATLEDLKAPSKLLMEQLASLVFPKHRVELVSIDMPQDFISNIEEKKDQVSDE
jgi:hypothetical protein